MALLRWFRFLWAVEVAWSQPTRTEARDFSRWIRIAGKPPKPHWRSPDKASASAVTQAKAPNPITGKSAPGQKYASSTVAHCESVLRQFYAHHIEV